MYSLSWRGFALLIFLSAQQVYAQAENCNPIQSYRAAIDCIALSAPDIRQSQLQVNAASAQAEQAWLYANPEIQSNNYRTSENGSSKQFSTDTQVYFPIQLGGKRSARGQLAEAAQGSAAAMSQTTKERVLIESAQSFHRLRQLSVEIELIEEAIHRFEKIISAFRKRTQLNPEQQVSLTVFKYALEEEKQKKAQALADQHAITSSLSLLVGQKLQITKNMLPQSPEKWPEISDKNIENFSEMKLSKSRLIEADANLNLAKANAWPDVKIGPAYERIPDPQGSTDRLGIALAMEIPVFDRNQGAKKVADVNRRIAAIEAEKKARLYTEGFSSILEQYKLITSALATAPSQAELEKGHKSFEAQFSRGLVPYTLIIEAHRQLHETVQTKHQQELRALDHLWRIYQMTGKLSPEVL